MNLIYGFQCKTPRCLVWLEVGELYEDTNRTQHHPINLGTDPLEITCPSCKRSYKYTISEVQRWERVREKALY
jgi:hypothetical protein